MKLDEVRLREPLRAYLRERAPRTIPFGKPAAVLVPLFEEQGEVYVRLLRRPANMRDHSGQVAFPGGKHDATDESLLATALREANEEIGIPSSEVDVLGTLDDYLTVTRYRITPFVAWVHREIELVPNEREVARIFSAPAAVFFGPPDAGTRPYRGYSVNGEFVWGATAAILRGLAEVVVQMKSA